MSNSPTVTILLPVYNGQADLSRAIESVFHQTFQDFELLIVDDASTDASYQIAKSFHDSRIRLMRNEHNLGLTPTLNVGVHAARGVSIARLDQDDAWDNPEKLHQQVEWLDHHPDCVLVGTYFTVYALGQSPKKVTPPTEDRDIRRAIMLRATFAHPTVMYRKSVVQAVGGYRNRFGKHVEDIDLWLRLGLRGTFHILPIFGLNYYQSAGGISRRFARVQLWNSLRVAWGNIGHWKHYPSLPIAIFRKSRRLLILFAAMLLKPILHRSSS